MFGIVDTYLGLIRISFKLFILSAFSDRHHPVVFCFFSNSIFSQYQYSAQCRILPTSHGQAFLKSKTLLLPVEEFLLLRIYRLERHSFKPHHYQLLSLLEITSARYALSASCINVDEISRPDSRKQVTPFVARNVSNLGQKMLDPSQFRLG